MKNERWLVLAGLVVWTAHFFGLYLIASIWLAAPTARWAALAYTAVCLGADLWILRRTAAAIRHADEGPVDRWMLTIGFLGAALSTLAVVWQGLPALFV